MKATIYKIRYEVVNNQVYTHFFGRAESGRRFHKVVNDLQPYLYVPAEAWMGTEHYSCVTGVEKGHVDLNNDEVYKIYVDFPFNVPTVRDDHFLTYEADVLFEDRVRYDLGLYHTAKFTDENNVVSKESVKPVTDKPIPPNIAIMDIENDDSKGLALPKYPTAEVYVIGILDKNSGVYTIFYTEGSKVNYEKVKSAYPELKIKLRKCENERLLFKTVTDYYRINSPDILTNWNIDYDVGYIRERAKKMKYECPDFNNIAKMDTLDMYAKRYVGTPNDLHLDYVAQDELGEGKIKRKGVTQEYEEDMTNLIIYNIKDVELVDRIIQKKSLVKFFLGMVQKVGSSVEVYGEKTKLADAYFLHKLNGILALPTVSNIKAKIEKGGEVLSAFTGVVRNVFVLDIKTAYPNVARTLNMSQETLELKPKKGKGYFVAKSGRHYKKEPRGLIPLIYDELVDERYELKEKLKNLPYKSEEWEEINDEQEVVKFTTNSFYGIMGSDYFRLNAGQIGSDITETVREMIKWIVNILKRSGFNVIYGDTDGVFFTVPESEGKELETLIDWANKIISQINKSFDKFARRFGANEHYFSIKLDRINEIMFQWGAKKHYIEVPLWDGQDVSDKPVEDRIIVKGARSKRRDSCQFTKDLMLNLFQYIVENDMNKIKKLILKSIEEIESENVDKRKFGMPSGWKRNYVSDVPQLRAAKYSNKYLGKNYQLGDTYWLYWGHPEDKPKTEVIALDWDENPDDYNLILDKEENIRKWVRLPIKSILPALGTSFEEITSGKKKTTLFENV